MLAVRSATLGMIAALVFVGCSKNEEAESTPAPTAPAMSTAPTASVPSQPIALTGPAEPQQWMGEAQTYQEAGDYDKAAQYLLAIQRQQQLLNEQQAEAYWRQMSGFQANLAARVAAGDPSAIAAANRLRAAAMR